MRVPPRLLIADDQAVHGYEILTAADGEEALEVARAQLPDLILLDIMMPKMDGLEVCRLLKGDAALPFMPIIMVTAKADTKDIVAGLEAGADEYLTKPVDQALAPAPSPDLRAAVLRGGYRLIDALVAWGDEKDLARRLREHRDAGATHVCIQPIDPEGSPRPDSRVLEALAPSGGVPV